MVPMREQRCCILMMVCRYCSIEPTDKKRFGIAVYRYLRETYGERDYYEVAEISRAVKMLGYPEQWECWALVAFMLPANAGEYFRARGTPMDILGMKREFVREMTDGKSDMLRLPDRHIPDGDITPDPLTRVNLVHIIAFIAGDYIGTGIVLGMLEP